MLTLRLFGPLRARRADGRAVVLPSRKAATMLAYLASQPERAHDRAGLARLFWEDLPERSAQNNLRVTLARVKALDGVGPIIESVAGTVRLARPDTLQSDVGDFERLLTATAAHQHERRATCPECRRMLLELAAIYRAPFLEGLDLPDCHAYEAWHEASAARLRRAAVAVLLDLADGYEAQGDLASAEFYARRLLALDPLHDGANLSLMRVVSRQGRRNEALVHFHRFAADLKAELDVEPDGIIVALFHELLMTSRPQPGPGSRPERAASPASGDAHVIGRASELADVAELLRERQLVTLHGIGGTGTTTLAAALAERLRAHYDEGVFEIRLSAVTDPTALPAVIARALGAPPPAGRPALAHLLEHLAPRRTLLVLDGLEHLLDARASLEAVVGAAPGVRILVTSREPLGLPQETVVALAGMDCLPDELASPTPEEVVGTSAGALFGAADLERELESVASAWRRAATHDLSRVASRVGVLRRFATALSREHVLIELLDAMMEAMHEEEGTKEATAPSA
jgi:DNA-binding SARP family transcriptional activator